MHGTGVPCGYPHLGLEPTLLPAVGTIVGGRALTQVRQVFAATGNDVDGCLPVEGD